MVTCILAFSLVFHAVNLSNAAVSEKTLQNFPPIPDAEYIVLFVERFMALWELINGQTHTTTTVTLAAHACRVNDSILYCCNKINAFSQLLVKMHYGLNGARSVCPHYMSIPS